MYRENHYTSTPACARTASPREQGNNSCSAATWDFAKPRKNQKNKIKYDQSFPQFPPSMSLLLSGSSVADPIFNLMQFHLETTFPPSHLNRLQARARRSSHAQDVQRLGCRPVTVFNHTVDQSCCQRKARCLPLSYFLPCLC